MGGRWFIFDASGTSIPMGFIRLGTGRDAADVAFATMYGPVLAHPPIIQTEAIQGTRGLLELPRHRPEAVSTDMGP